MKLTCPFCHTEYSADIAHGRRCSCACCGHVFSVAGRRRNSFLIFFAGALLLLSMLTFAAAIVARHIVRPLDQGPLSIHTVQVTRGTGADGAAHISVQGIINNDTEKIYGIPDLNIVMKDEKGDTIATVKFPPPSPLVDAGESVRFSHTVADVAPNAKKVSVEFVE